MTLQGLQMNFEKDLVLTSDRKCLLIYCYEKKNENETAPETKIEQINLRANQWKIIEGVLQNKDQEIKEISDIFLIKKLIQMNVFKKAPNQGSQS